MTFDRIYICLLRIGDQISILPMLHADSKSGLRVAMMVHRDFAGLCSGTSYAQEIIWDGPIEDAHGAIRLAESMSKDVRVLRVLATEEMQREIYERAGYKSAMSDSHDKELWRLAGRAGDFAKHPLIFDRRNPDRELALLQSLNPQKAVPRHRRWILISADGTTSPFPYKDLLIELVKRRCNPKHKTIPGSVIDLNEIKAEKFYDFIGLYEKSYCMIASDSAHLHLSAACPELPVLALTQDRPSLWHGSAWRKQFVFYCRYSDFPKRAIEMLSAIERIEVPGSPFIGGAKGHKLVHVFSAYELNGEFSEARETWEREYLTGRWIATPIELGAIGRDSKTVLKDQKRYPFLKDVIRLACMRARDEDVIVLTREWVQFEIGLSDRLTNDNPWYAHRRFREPETFHPACDLFAFSKQWWREHNAEVPDLILGKDRYWPAVLLSVLKRHGGKELEQAIYRKEQEK